MLASERIIEDAKEICSRLKIEPLNGQQLLVVSLIVGHEIERLEEKIAALKEEK